MKIKVGLLLFGILGLITMILGFTYSRLFSEHSQLLQIRRQEVPYFIDKIEELEEENKELRNNLSLFEQNENDIKSKEDQVDELKKEYMSLETELSEISEVYNLDTFHDHKIMAYEEGFCYDLEFNVNESERLYGYVKLWLDDIYFNEKFITESDGITTRMRIVSTPAVESQKYETYMEYKYLMDNYVVAHMKIYDFYYGLKNQDYNILESVIIEDDLFPAADDIEVIIDAYMDVIDLGSLEISFVGINELGFEYKLEGMKDRVSYSESIHVNAGDGLIYISDYRGRYEWTGHHIPLEDW